MQMPQVEQIKTTVCKSNHLLLTAETFRQLRRGLRRQDIVAVMVTDVSP